MMLAGKTIVVTGAASGIGAETSRLLRAEGARVIGVDLRPVENVDLSVVADLAEQSSVEAGLAAAGTGIDGLCNIAGVPPTHPPERVLLVNFVGLRHLTLGMIPRMNDGASIVNVASLAANGWRDAVDEINTFLAGADFETTAGLLRALCVDEDRSYRFSKELLVAWTMMNRWTWRNRGIRMNCVSPGPVATPIYPDFAATLKERAREADRVMDRLGQPADIAPAIAFLLTDASQWIRGVNLPCDGGMYAHYAHAMYGLGGGGAQAG